MRAIVIALALALPLAAQERIVSTRISSGASGTNFTVDGTAYYGAVTLLWPEHSKHTLSIGTTQEVSSGIRYGFTGWKSSTATELPGTVVVTASPDITSYTAIATLWYRIFLRFNPGGYPFRCDVPDPAFGRVWVDGGCYATNTEIWVEALKTIEVQAFPPAGYVFLGWPEYVSPSQAYDIKILVKGPFTLSPKFSPAVRLTLATSPPNLNVVADRTVVNTPVTLDWAPGSPHLLQPVSPQTDRWGKLWVFDSWGHGGTEQQLYTTPAAANVPVTITANFVEGMRVNFSTVPLGLKLVVDGSDSWPNYGFVWKGGSKHTVAAPLEQVHANGRKHVFTRWSNGAGASQEITVTQDSLIFIADYEMLGKLTVASTADVPLVVQNAECRPPCVVEQRQGTSFNIAAPVSVPVNDAGRLEFERWSDGGPRERTVTLGAEEQALTAVYRFSYRVGAAAEPAEAAAFRFEPASVDGFYPDGTDVTVVVQPKPGYRLTCWEGDLTGKSASGVLKVSGPRWAKAVLEKVPYIAPTGVRNAAGETPEPEVAAGSLITIYGVNLAPALETAPGSPLPQTLAGVTARVGERLLPLLLASPEQITAQLPSGLEPGGYKVTVLWDATQVTAPFAVVRNAPGLFSREVDGQRVVLAAHAGGELIGPDTPAGPGETITLFGTGFGPYEREPLDGFAVPDSPAVRLADKVEIVTGQTVTEAVSVVAAPGQVGVTAVLFTVPTEAAGSLELKVRVNGRESNTVTVPVE